jgi:hypothetical protein
LGSFECCRVSNTSVPLFTKTGYMNAVGLLPVGLNAKQEDYQ